MDWALRCGWEGCWACKGAGKGKPSRARPGLGGLTLGEGMAITVAIIAS